MLYQVTCKRCGKKFRISVDNVLRTTSACPYCGQKLSILIPNKQTETTDRQALLTQKTSLQNENVRPLSENKYTKETVKKNNNWFKTIIFILFLSILIVGGFLYFNWQQQKKKELIRIERQHHRDSVMKVREMLQAKSVLVQKQKRLQTMACTFLHSFYINAVLSGADVTQYESYLTNNCKRILYGDNENAFDLDKQTAWWGLFGTLSGLENADELIRNLRISYYDKDWYKVRLSQNGTTDQRLIKLKIENNRFLIDDVR